MSSYPALILWQVPAVIRPQYCKLVCEGGEWRGPYCGDDPDKGEEDDHNYWR